MATIQQLAYGLLVPAVNGETPQVELFDNLDAHLWSQLFRLMRQNNVVALTAASVNQLGEQVPRSIKMPWLMECEKASSRYRMQADVEQDIKALMQEHGIECLTLKGTRLSRYYPTPECREFGDLDLYFFDRQADADRLMADEHGVAISNDAHHHTKYVYRGVTVESHYNFVNVHTPRSNRRYEQLLKSLAPSPTFELLFMLRHMAVHFAASRITLRDLTDWHLATQQLESSVDWDRVRKATKDFGMAPFADALTTIAHLRFGHDIPLRFAPENDIAEKVEHDMLFGSPQSEEYAANGWGRLSWKLRRYRANRWKQRLVFNDSPLSLLLTSLGSHSRNPHSILHKI